MFNRRNFLKSSVGAAASLSALSQVQVRGANEKVILGVMGLGGRGTQLALSFAQRSDVELSFLCDVNRTRLDRAAAAVASAQGRKPKLVQDCRRILENAEVDGLINATPDHWHALGTILACQAGKDVYVEKPLSHNLWEGRQMIQAARRYQRVVQVGTQSRSAPYIHEAAEYVRSGELGDVHVVRVFNMMQHPFREEGPEAPVPEYLDYDLWCGPAPRPPYKPSRYWLNESIFSCGPIAGDAIHQLDLARVLMGDPDYPDTVSNAGGILSLRDGRDTADTQLATFEYGDRILLLEAGLWMPYMKKIPQPIRNSDQFPDFPFCSTRIELLGTKGFMYVGRHGGGWQAFDADGALVRSEYGRQADREHQDDFVACIRTRKRPSADVEQGHYSTLICHLANISGRVGNRKLRFDSKTETFPGDAEANAYLKREYRAPWIVPESV